MTIAAELRRHVREHAQFACEFCEVTETDTGGELTIDHFRPRTKGGHDETDNLLCCCTRCNQYKSDYWPMQPEDIPRWKPRQESRAQHLLEMEDGTLHPLTRVGVFTIHRLRLNRPALVAYRVRRRQHAVTARLLTQYHTMLELHERLQAQVTVLMAEQRQLLEEQRALLNLLLSEPEEG